MNLQIRDALIDDAMRLTEIAFAAKRTWNYPEAYFKIWADELTISQDYILSNKVILAEIENKIVGFVSVVFVPSDTVFGQVVVNEGYWMDHLFIDPLFQKKGIGHQLFNVAIAYCIDKGIDDLSVFVDPNATIFYEKMGAKFVRKSPSSIEGRTIPVYRIVLNENKGVTN